MTTTQLATILRALDECREPDFALLGIVCDALQEAGDPDWKGFWWALERKKWPSIATDSSFLVVWGHAWINGRDRLPYDVYKHHGGLYNIGLYRSFTAAFRDLANMLRKAEADGVDVSKL